MGLSISNKSPTSEAAMLSTSFIPWPGTTWLETFSSCYVFLQCSIVESLRAFTLEWNVKADDSSTGG